MRCTAVVLCCTLLLIQLKMTSSQTEDDSTKEDCSDLDSCDRCTSGDPELNLTRCVWRNCDNDNNTGCISDMDEAGGCVVFNEKDSCPVIQAEDDTPKDEDDTPKAGGFSMASFIGGIILVLVLQAGAFFAMRFLKTKDSSYETM
ncbi:CD164 sialomucin-like 2 protein [Electrophorus electricus]|uniref:CD164 sialomucin-like 2 protein n=1 Tax=Electrophorus electricus TaxID=8005 RepID=UPI000F09BB16|nr:CD164 sialomucin-like 2 protein [Electrophorus electricus]